MTIFKLAKSAGLVLTIALIGIIFIENAQTNVAAYKFEYTVNFSSDNFIFDKIDDYDLIKSNDHSYLNIPGQPMLPMHRTRIALPDGMTAENITVVSVVIEDIDGEFNLFPAQPPVETKFQSLDIIRVEPDMNTYNSSQPYPSIPVKLVRQSDLAGQSFAEIDIYPLQYIPAQKSLQLITEITFAIEGNDGYQCGDYLPENASSELKDKYRERINALVSNQEDVILKSSPAGLKRSDALPSDTPFDHVIITSVFFADLYQPLIDWHLRRGLRDTVITTDYIYSNYDGTDKEKIRNFVIDANQTWGTMYFLMAGEHTTVPFEYRSYDNTSIPSDAYYADFDDDWDYEVFVGRITADNATEINRFVNKILRYETNPPDLNYISDVTLLGMDLTIAADAPYYTLTRGEYLMDSIDANCIPPGLIVTKVYDTHGGNHRDNFIAAINDGQNLIDHNDHCNYSVMGCGDRNHGWYISSYNVDYFTNYHKYCSIVSIGCYANKMDHNDAISEHFIFDTDSSGAVSFTSNTRSGWFYVGDAMSLSSDLNYHWWIGLFNHNKYHLGEALAYCKNNTSVESQHPYSDWTLNLLGDPAMPLWTDNLVHPITTHLEEVEAIPGQFTVNVELFGGVGIENALVCLWKGSEIYQKAYTNADGDAVFDIYPTTHGAIFVTATKQNMKPYLGEAQVVGNVPPQCLTPGDTTVFLCTPGEVSIPVGCYDPDDNLEYGPTLVRGEGQIINNYWYYTPTANEVVEVTISCSDSAGYSCETTFYVNIVINTAPVLTVPEDVTVLKVWPPEELVYPITIADENPSACVITSGPGIIEDGSWKFTPADDEVTDIVIQLTDGCDEVDIQSFHLDYEVYKCGDASDNGEVNILDVTMLINHLYKGGEAPDPIEAGDANGNNVLNILDITHLIAFLYQYGPAPQCP